VLLRGFVPFALTDRVYHITDRSTNSLHNHMLSVGEEMLEYHFPDGYLMLITAVCFML
jgi:hypothetical protein